MADVREFDKFKELVRQCVFLVPSEIELFLDEFENLLETAGLEVRLVKKKEGRK